MKPIKIISILIIVLAVAAILFRACVIKIQPGQTGVLNKEWGGGLQKKDYEPGFYLALGISGAPEHIEGMKDAELIVAVNTDETAPIFEHAHYGTTADLFDLVPALTKRLK